jgi:hypothetical protein
MLSLSASRDCGAFAHTQPMHPQDLFQNLRKANSSLSIQVPVVRPRHYGQEKSVCKPPKAFDIPGTCGPVFPFLNGKPLSRAKRIPNKNA